MTTKNTKDDLIISHLEYIRTRVDQINGRVRENERQISWIRGIGVSFIFIFSSVMTWLGLNK
tara:strand:+ start:2813 stop:2998 length:186 start_codon:yes stop_codon:yes gene_type:complete